MHFRFCLVFIFCSLLFCSIAAGNANGEAGRFEGIGPFGGDVRSLLIDSQQPNIIYLGTSSGMIFKSSDAGDSWSPLHPGIGERSYVIDSLVQHPIDPSHIYAGAWDLHSEGGGLFESRDGGLHWTEVALPQPSVAVRGLSICRSKPSYMIVATLSGPYVTADGGRNWKRVGGGDLQKTESVAIDPVDYRILYVGTWRLGYKSVDFGKSWVLMGKGMPLDSDVFSITVDPREPSIVYSSACSGVYRSSNKAALWNRLRLLPDRFTIRAQVVYLDPVNSQRVYSGTTEGLFVSSNDGRNWTRLTSSAITVNAIQVDPENNRRILIGTEYEGVLLSEDGGKTWKESNTGFVHRQISWILPNPEKPGSLVAGLASGRGGMYSYDSQTGKWRQSQIIPGMRVFSFLILPDKRGKLAGTSQGLYWQASESAPWTKLKGSIAKRAVYSLEKDPRHPVVYAGTDQGIYRASLPALDFRLPPGYRLSPQVWCIRAPANGTEAVYAGSSLGLLRSWDRGAIWNVISSYGLPARAPILSLAVSPSNRNHIFAGTSVGIYESSNGGIHWRQAGKGNMGVSVPAVIFGDSSGQRILAADNDSGAIFYSKDEGQSWEKISPRNASPVTTLANSPDEPSRIFIGTQTDGVLVLTMDDLGLPAENQSTYGSE